MNYNYLIIILISISNLLAQKKYEITYKILDNYSNSYNSTLITSTDEALFTIDKNLNLVDVSLEGFNKLIEGDSTHNYFYTKQQTVYTSINDLFYKDDVAKKLDWDIHNTITKKIGIYDCIEATVFINGRNYTVWFTKSIPIHYGPLKLHGLPGLIVAIQEDKKYLKIELQSIQNLDDTTEFNSTKKNILSRKKWMTYTEFEKEFMNERIENAKFHINKIKELSYTGKIPNEYYHFVDDVDQIYLDIPLLLKSKLKKLVRGN